MTDTGAEGRGLDRSIWAEVADERDRAHAKHGDTSMESQPVDSLDRLMILMEEVGEVAEHFLGPLMALHRFDHLESTVRAIVQAGNRAKRVNDARHDGAGPAPCVPLKDPAALGAELIQVAAMAGGWADAAAPL